MDRMRGVESVGPWESIVQLYHIYEWELESFSILSNRFEGHSFLELQNNLTGLLKPEVDETLKPRAVSNRHDFLQIFLRLLTRSMLEMLQKGCHNIYFYNDVDANLSA